jgi:hypothetical protein
MNHPYDLLADLVDGTLDEETLAEVQAHLRTCASCREDLAYATAGRAAARSLPQESPPADLHERIVREAGGGRGRAAPAWYRWAGAAAAAAVVLVIALALPDVGDDADVQRAGDAATTEDAAGGAATADDVVVSVEDTDYDEAELRELSLGADQRATLSAPAAAEADVGRANSNTATRCVERALDERPVGQLARLIQARFLGRDAYIALYLESPGAGQAADLATVVVAATDDCSFLTLASARLSP